jgi:hypothetical protein
MALNDITTGSSFGCGTDGFPATHGWDAVSKIIRKTYIYLRYMLTLLHVAFRLQDMAPPTLAGLSRVRLLTRRKFHDR